MAFRNIPPNGFPAIPDIEDLEGVEKDVSTLKTTTAGLAEDVSELKSGLTNLDTSIYGGENKSNLDFNTLKEKYSCRIGNMANCTNTPNSASTGVSGVLIVEPHGTTIIQKFYGNLGESHRLSFDTGITWESWI